MNLKIFGDTQKIDWQALGIKMPFAPMHELATKYELETPNHWDDLVPTVLPQEYGLKPEWMKQTFETDIQDPYEIFTRILWRTNNTMTALDQATTDTVCINLGGGFHHAQKYPDTGYAYSLINDICWAVDYQLGQNKTVGIIDLDFHFGGGTFEYYRTNLDVCSYDYHHPKGILRQNSIFASDIFFHNYTSEKLYSQNPRLEIESWIPDKFILNLGTDWLHSDPLFGKYGNMYDGDLLAVWTDIVDQIVKRGIPLAITMGGGYGDKGLNLYQSLIEYLQQL